MTQSVDRLEGPRGVEHASPSAAIAHPLNGDVLLCPAISIPRRTSHHEGTGREKPDE